MGASPFIQGFKSKDGEDFKKHEKVLRACLDAGIKKLPEETAIYFGDDAVELCVLEESLEASLNGCYEDYQGDMEDGYEIKVKDIPKDVDIIRVGVSY